MSLILDGTNGLSDVDGTAGTPAIRGSDANTGVFFGTDIVGVSTGGTERMRVDASGNVGIGTGSPTGKFNVSGSVANDLTTFSTADAATTVLNNVNGVATGRATKILFRNSGLNLAGVAGVYTGFNGAGDVAGALAFGTQTNVAGGVVERMRIDSSGNLLVGTTSSGGVGFSLTTDAAGRTAISNTTFGGGFTHNSFRYNGTQVGAITTSTTATTYATSSDYRLKNTVEPMTGALAKVALLKPCTYKWNADESNGEGFIAHELAEVCPDAVTGEKDAVETYTDEDGVEQTRPKYQGIDTSFLVATLTAAIQEQQAIIESLTARVVALEGA